MTNSLYDISVSSLAIALSLVIPVLLILYFWGLRAGKATYALARMLVQLVLVGYVLSFLFGSTNSLLILAVLTSMVLISSWIALGSIEAKRSQLYGVVLIAILLGGGGTLWVITQWVLVLDPWYAPHYLIPLAGMIFANAMNCVSLAAERMNTELNRGETYWVARSQALQAAMIPIINSLFAVGLVSLPGMMTGQILSGVSPLIAARYQILVMCMIFSSAGLSAAIYLVLAKPNRLADLLSFARKP
ncbi:MAG: hypothetical protein COB04_02995 [Gammaproteobacteria bacterium]|nr:MAG: hypothetical protein COB04_02995 [Gammaproteobacteria bacterium]